MAEKSDLRRLQVEDEFNSRIAQQDAIASYANREIERLRLKKRSALREIDRDAGVPCLS